MKIVLEPHEATAPVLGWTVSQNLMEGKGPEIAGEREETALENTAVVSSELAPQGAKQDEKLTLYVQWENQKVGQVHIS